MTSTIAWLDTSAEQQRQVRELISLFSQSESRDELGLGQIRDAFSETLFPGTSVIQTRARYFLIVPWIYRQGAQRGRSGDSLKSWVETGERKLIETLRVSGHTRGLIGRVAGSGVKILPSSIYWSGLARFGILTQDLASDELGFARAGQEADELAERVVGDWHPTLPMAPPGFPDELEDGFELAPDESEWLSERILDAAPDSLLAHLLQQKRLPDPDSWAPWADTSCVDLPSEIRATLNHAELFSLSMHGAALSYNLQIAELYERAGYNRVAIPVDDYRARLADWNQECADASHRLRSWDRSQMWERVRQRNLRISTATRLFVERWTDAVVRGQASAAADDRALRQLVAERERKQKRSQSRLVNERLLRTWAGASGSAQLVYRWQTVRTLVTDILEGSARAGS